MDSIRTFDIETQLSIDKHSKIDIMPNVENKLLEHGYYDHAEDAIEFLSTQHNTWVSRGGKRRTRSKRQRGGAPSSKKRKREEKALEEAETGNKQKRRKQYVYSTSS